MKKYDSVFIKNTLQFFYSYLPCAFECFIHNFKNKNFHCISTFIEHYKLHTNRIIFLVKKEDKEKTFLSLLVCNNC